MTKQRLSKILSANGIASRRKAEELIFAGKVTVNGEKVLIPQTMVDFDSDEIQVAGTPLKKVEKRVYYILNKPPGFLCTSLEVSPAHSILTLFPKELRLFTVGRLDKETSGLLLVTNDGHFAQNVIHPSKNLSKEYLVKTDKDVTEVHLKAISAGALVEGVWIKPISVEKVRKGTLKVAVSEGKKREVRTIIEAASLNVLELKRIRIGNLVLGSLPLGSYRELTPKERDQLIQ